jgi:polysaccharide export outer membrane protein
MTTFAKFSAIVLLLAPSVAGQTTTNPSLSSSWSTPPTGVAAMPAGVPASRQVAPVQSSGMLPVVLPSSTTGTNSMMMTITSGPVHLGPGDLLEIGVFESPELTTQARVTSEGEISFPLLGKLHVGGLTPQEVQNLIREQLVAGNFVKDPQVAAFVTEYANQSIYVFGEVSRPGAYPVVGDHRLFELISAAGGFSPRAGKTITVTRRVSPDSPEVIHFSRHPNLAVDNIEITAGDTINVGEAGVVYVVGNVLHPGGFLLDGDQQLTVIQALALAAGARPGAAMKNARIVRMTAQGRQQIPVNLNKILTSKNTDVMLQDQDILYVPNSIIRSGLSRGADAAVQASIGAAIYRW